MQVVVQINKNTVRSNGNGTEEEEKCHDEGPGKPGIWDLREKRRLDYPWGAAGGLICFRYLTMRSWILGTESRWTVPHCSVLIGEIQAERRSEMALNSTPAPIEISDQIESDVGPRYDNRLRASLVRCRCGTCVSRWKKTV